MTAPWFLNPWREVRELRREAWEQHKWAMRERDNALSERIARTNAEAENAELKRTIEQLSKWVPHDPRPVGGDVIRMQKFSDMEDLP